MVKHSQLRSKTVKHGQLMSNTVKHGQHQILRQILRSLCENDDLCENDIHARMTNHEKMIVMRK